MPAVYPNNSNISIALEFNHDSERLLEYYKFNEACMHPTQLCWSEKIIIMKTVMRVSLCLGSLMENLGS